MGYNENSSSLTLLLISTLDGENTKVEPSILDPLIEIASENKVLLELLEVLDMNNSLRETQARGLRRKTEAVKVLSEILVGLDYVFFKLIKPICYLPSDIDILIKSEDTSKAIKEIKSLGYEPIVKEPYCIEFSKGSSAIDLYAHPTVGNIVYLDGQALLEHTTIADYNGVEIRTLESYAEALVAAAHASYKENIYTLNDFFTFKEWISKKSFKLAEELGCKTALELIMSLNQVIEKGILEMPYRIPFPIWLMLMLSKVYNDNLTRATFPRVLRAFRDPRFGNLILSRLTRSTY